MSSKWSLVRTLAGAAASLVLLTVPAHAEEQDAPPPSTKKEDGFRVATDIAIRAIPIGLNAIVDGAWRTWLFDSESVLFKDTYVDAGLNLGLSPAYLWAGGFVEALPIAVLQLRGSYHYVNYYGNFGYLTVPQPGASATDWWDLDTLKASGDDDLGVASSGTMMELRATPRIRIKDRIVVTSELRLTNISMDLEDPYTVYYEPYFDIAMKRDDTFFMARPTAGWLWGEDLKKGYVLTGVRWEYTKSYGAEVERQLLAALALWRVPTKWWDSGNPRVAFLGGSWLDHPNRKGELYFATQLSLEYGAR